MSNEFCEFSSFVKDMLDEENNTDRNEVVMFRNTEESTLRASEVDYSIELSKELSID